MRYAKDNKKRNGVDKMACNGYRNVETWKFMVYFEDFLCETLIEQEKYNEKKIRL